MGYFTSEAIEGNDNAGGGVGAVTALSQRLCVACLFVGVSQCGLTIVGEFVQEKQQLRGSVLSEALPNLCDASQLRLIVGVRTVNMVTSAFPVDVAALQHTPDP
jgi:hypothetical protein